jgi:uncharacterized protein
MAERSSFDPAIDGDVTRSPSDDDRQSHILELSRDECLRLLASQSFGRVAVNIRGGPPVIRPVNYAFDQPSQSIVFRTAQGSKFHALLQSAKAAFEVDRVEGGSNTGWSVIVQGVTNEVTHPGEIRRLNTIGLEPWAPGHKRHWVHIRVWTVSGRRIVIAADNVQDQNP